MPGQPITLHLIAADGHPFDITVAAPTVRTRVTVRVSGLQTATVATTARYDGTAWQPIGAP